MRQLLVDPPTLTAKFAILKGILESDMKNIITKAENLQRLPETKSPIVRKWLEDFKRENELIIDAEIERRPAFFQEVDAACRVHSKLSFIPALDQSREFEVIQKVDSRNVNNEYDGVVHFFIAGDDAQTVYQEAAKLVKP